MSSFTSKHKVLDHYEHEKEISINNLDNCFWHWNFGCMLDNVSNEDWPRFKSIEALMKHYGYTEVEEKPTLDDNPIIAHMKEWHEENDWIYFCKYAYWQAHWFQLRKKLDELAWEVAELKLNNK